MHATNAVEVPNGGTPIDPFNLNEEIDEEKETKQQNNESNKYDTTTIEGLTLFIADIKEIRVGEGDKLFFTVDKLPMVNSKLSRTKCIKRILSKVDESLEKPFNPKVRIAQLSREHRDELKRAINKHCLNADKLKTLKAQILQPYELALQLLNHDAEVASIASTNNNSEVNRIAVLSSPATTLCEKLNVPIEEEHRPTFQEQSGGPTAYKNSIYEELIKVSDVLGRVEEVIDSHHGQIELAELRCDEAHMELLIKVIDCKHFPHFLEEHKKEIEDDIMEIVRNAKRRRLGKRSSDK